MPSPPLSKPPAAILSPSSTMENSASSWLFCTTQSASSVETQARFISPSRLALPLLPSSDPPTPLATALIPLKKLSCAALMPLPPTSAANPPILPFSISPWIKSSTPCNAASERFCDRRRLFRALARSPRLSPRHRRAFPRTSYVPLHFSRCRRRITRPYRSRLCRRQSPQARGPHCYWPVRPH